MSKEESSPRKSIVITNPNSKPNSKPGSVHNSRPTSKLLDREVQPQKQKEEAIVQTDVNNNKKTPTIP
jgi:hypothetical protein